VVVAAALLVGGCALPMGPRSMPEGMGPMRSSGDRSYVIADPYPDAPELRVEAGDLWFEPVELQVAAGGPFNLVLVNSGAVFHDLVVEGLEVGVGADPGETAAGGLVIDEPGEYRFECTVPGHAPAGMEGTITVE